MLQSIFVQHLKRGHGVCILEPHHDLSYDTLSSLVAGGYFNSSDAFDRLVYVDWGDPKYVVPFNVLSHPRPAHATALYALEAMIRVWPELRQAPMFQTLFLSAIVALVANNLPITNLYRLLTDADFRRSALHAVTDPLIHQSFAVFDRIKDQLEAAGSLWRRSFLLQFDPAAKLSFSQPDTLDFRKIMDEGRGLILNLGNIESAETKRLIGAMLLVQIEQAALSRTDLSPEQRRPFTVLVDEWPSFAAQDETIATILSQTRKFNLRMYLAAQSASGISSARLSGALENAKLTISLQLGRDSAVHQSHHIAAVDPFVLREEAQTPTQHAQYLPILEQFESWTQDLMNLPPRVAYVKFHGAKPIKIRTLSVPDSRPHPDLMATVLSTYKAKYLRTAEIAEVMASRSVPTNGSDHPPARSRPFTLFDATRGRFARDASTS